MAESSSPPSAPAAAAAPAAELGVTEQPGPQSPPPSPPGLEEPLDGADPEVPHPDLAPVAFFCLRQTTSPRNWCIKMVCNPYPLCDGGLLPPLICCVTMASSCPLLLAFLLPLQVFDDFIFVFFAMEMVLKMVALGIFGKKCYLGDTWNRLDFFIVMAGMVEYSLDLQNINLSAIRTVRVLRPLKAINRVPSMRILVNLLLDTLPMLGNVLLLCFFVFFIFGIIGVQLWAGLLRNRCFLEENFTIQGDVALPPYYQPEEDDEMPFICSLSGDNGIMGCHEIPPLKEQGRECCLSKDDVYDFGAGRQDLNASGLCVNWNRYYNVCRTGSANPHKGAINFDNIGYAWIVIFQVITLEGWVEIMYYVMDAHSFYNFIYFILLIIVGSFFMINLCLVVIATQFSETKQREHRLMLEQRQRFLSSSTVASYAEPGDCYEEIFQYVCHILRKARRRALGLYQALQSRRRAPTLPCVCFAELCPRHSPLDPMPHTPVQPISAVLASDPASCPRCQHEGKICNVVFTSMFALEMLLKLAAFGLFDYLRNPYNIFDSIIVIISIWEILGQADGGLSVLRTFRLLRVLKLVRFMPALRRQLVVLMKTMDNVATFCMLLMLFIFIFSILGMHIFGCKFSLRTDTGDTVPDRKNFDSLLWAIVTVFQILTQEDWNVVLYNGMASTSPWASLYFVALMTFGNYVLFNLLVAILVEGFQAEGDANRSYSDEDQSSSNMEEFDKLQEGLDSGGDPKICPIPMTPNGHLDPSLPLGGHLGPPGAAAPAPRLSLQPDPVLVALGSRKSSVMSLGRMSCDQRSLGVWGGTLGRSACQSSLRLVPGCRGPDSPARTRQGPCVIGFLPWPHCRRQRAGLWGQTYESSNLASATFKLCGHEQALSEPASLPVKGRRSAGGPSLVFDHPGGRRCAALRSADPAALPSWPCQTLCFRVRKMIDVYKPDWCEVREDWSVYLFSPENRFRVLCQTIIAHKLFDYVVLAFIFLNCITIALERPQIEAGSTERIFLTVSNYIFTAIFVGEMTLKVVSLGLYFGEQAYLRSSWNVLDGFLVFVSIIDIVVSVASAGGAKILGVLRVLRLLRTLRPLRVISRAPGLKLVVETLISSLKPIGNIVLICCAFFIIFGILGVQLFKGKFYHCLGVDTRNITNRSDCMAANYRWVHHKYNFDNLGQALMSLFVLASKDGWVNIMYNGLDAVAVDQQSRGVLTSLPLLPPSSLLFPLVLCFPTWPQPSVVCATPPAPHPPAEAQRLPYYATYCPTRLLIHSMCTSHYLDIFITFIICLNVVTMSLEHYNQPTSLETALKYCNYMFTTVFVLEAVLKLVAFGLRRFFKDRRWNQLDLAIVLLSVMGITLEEIEINAALPINPTIIRIMRVLRIARVLKLLKMATGMRALLDTVVQALPQVGNLGLLFMLLFFIYAALGVELFGKLVCNDENPCEGMSRHATFENFGMAFLTLFQVSTGDNWNGIMKDTLRDCTHDERSCLSSLQFVSPLYFVSFVLTAQFVLINVVVAVLMKHLDDSNKEAQEDAEMDAELELEMAHGLGHGRREPGGRPSLAHPTENLWLDSVSLIIKDSLEGELTIIDNLSGSIFHHYSSPAGCEKCHHDKQEVQLAETEAFSLNSDKSSSILLGDDLSLEGPTACPLGPKDSRGEPDAPEPMHGGEGGECFFPLSNTAVSSDPENFLWERETVPSNPVRSWLKHESAAPPTPFSPDASSPLLPMPAEFFHPAVSASQKGQEKVAGAGTLPKIALQGSWASLRSPNVNCTLLRQVWAPPCLRELSCWGTSECDLNVQVEVEGQIWGMGGLACRTSSTALARATSWAGRGHRADRLCGCQGSGRSRSCPRSHSMTAAELGMALVPPLTPALCQAVCQAGRLHSGLLSFCVAGV
uniref:Calcium voltage-gated channel subunit alpha1 I n=1 Tax=Panthera tigris altaica TaxID=74533 RepID=A0A8C9MDG0_PANTA